MSDDMIARKWYQNWMIVILLFAVIASVHFAAAFLKSIPLNLAGMILYALATFGLVKKELWGEIGIGEISSWQYVLRGVLWGMVVVVVSSLLLYYWVGYSTDNYLVIMARQQLSYGVITLQNAWEYFPVAAIGYCTLSPLTEEPFFRGLMMRALAIRFSERVSNVVQGVLFGFVHLAYLWLTEFNGKLIVTMIPVIAVVGCLYGWVAQRTGSVFSSMIVHSVVNGLLITWVYGIVIPVLG
jgi:membrane protease YdiL (CAAX protease family)